MADQKRWFKVWTSLLVDMDDTPDEVIGRWVRLGCRIALVGTKGKVQFRSEEHLANFLKVPQKNVIDIINVLPNVVFRSAERRDGPVCVTFRKWHKYQRDSSRERQARFRESGDAIKNKKRGDKNKRRKEENISVRENGESNYEIKTPEQIVMAGYKDLKGIQLEDREWDRENWKRWARPAQSLLRKMGGKNEESAKKAIDCIEAVKMWLEKQNLNWNLNTVDKHAWDWKNGRLGK